MDFYNDNLYTNTFNDINLYRNMVNIPTLISIRDWFTN